jgi:uncharacterized membrane protein YhiD involved in acid resistance
VKTQKSKNQRSFWAAYGPIVFLGAFLTLVISVLFTSALQSSGKSSELAAAENRVKETAAQEALASSQTDQKIREMAIRTKGDWNKATSEEKMIITRVSSGHGPEMLKQVYGRVTGKTPAK